MPRFSGTGFSRPLIRMSIISRKELGVNPLVAARSDIGLRPAVANHSKAVALSSIARSTFGPPLADWLAANEGC